MYDFKDFENEDKYERFKALQKKIHKDAVEEYLQEQYNKAKAAGENKMLIFLSEKIYLKDDTLLSEQDLKEYTKRKNLTIYPTTDKYRWMNKELEKENTTDSQNT